MPVAIESWWFIPLLMTLLVGILCPATGAILITHRRLMQANLISHSVLPGLALALAIGIDSTIGGVLSGLLGALVAERIALKSLENNDAVSIQFLPVRLALGFCLFLYWG